MKYTPSDIVSVSLYMGFGTAILGLGLILFEELERSLAIWVYLVSCTIFVLHWAMTSTKIDRMRGKRTELGKEIDALRERVDALERGIEE